MRKPAKKRGQRASGFFNLQRFLVSFAATSLGLFLILLISFVVFLENSVYAQTAPTGPTGAPACLTKQSDVTGLTFSWSGTSGISYTIQVFAVSTPSKYVTKNYTASSSSVSVSGTATWFDATNSGLVDINNNTLYLSPQVAYGWQVAVQGSTNWVPGANFTISSCAAPGPTGGPITSTTPQNPGGSSYQPCIAVNQWFNPPTATTPSVYNSTNYRPFASTGAPYIKGELLNNPSFNYQWSPAGGTPLSYTLYLTTDGGAKGDSTSGNLINTTQGYMYYSNATSPLTASRTGWTTSGSIDYVDLSLTSYGPVYKPSQTYFWYVRANYGTGGTGPYLWSTQQNFTTPIACKADLSVSVSANCPPLNPTCNTSIPRTGFVQVKVTITNTGNTPVPTNIGANNFQIPLAVYRTIGNQANGDDSTLINLVKAQCWAGQPTGIWSGITTVPYPYYNGMLYSQYITNSFPTDYTYQPGTNKQAPFLPYSDGFTVIPDITKNFISSLSLGNTLTGSGTFTPPLTVTPPGAGGTGGVFQPVIDSNGSLINILVINGGSGYSTGSVNFSNVGSGSGAGATAVISGSGGSVLYFRIDSAGANYPHPTINFYDNGTAMTAANGYTNPPSAIAVVDSSGAVRQLIITNPGSGFNSSHTITATVLDSSNGTSVALNVITQGLSTGATFGPNSSVSMNVAIPVPSIPGDQQMRFIVDPSCTNPYESYSPPIPFLTSPFAGDPRTPYCSSGPPANNTWCNNYKDFTYSVNIPGYFSTTGGSVGTQAGISLSYYPNPLPATPNYLADYNIMANSILTCDGAYSPTCSNLGNALYSKSGWEINQYPAGTSIGTNQGSVYQYLASRVLPTAKSTGTSTCLEGSISAANKLYYCSSDLNLDASFVPPTGGSTVVFVDGDLTINNNIQLPLNTADALVFVVQGNIHVASNVTEIDGVYIAGGYGGQNPAGYNKGYLNGFDSGTTVNGYSGPQLLTVKGAIYANKVNLNRYSAFTGTTTAPGETINYDPKYMAVLTTLIGTAPTSWQEVAP